MTAKLPSELTKKFKVTLNDYANSIVFTNSLTRIVDGREVEKFSKKAKVSEIPQTS